MLIMKMDTKILSSTPYSTIHRKKYQNLIAMEQNLHHKKQNLFYKKYYEKNSHFPSYNHSGNYNRTGMVKAGYYADKQELQLQ